MHGFAFYNCRMTLGKPEIRGKNYVPVTHVGTMHQVWRTYWLCSAEYTRRVSCIIARTEKGKRTECAPRKNAEGQKRPRSCIKDNLYSRGHATPIPKEARENRPMCAPRRNISTKASLYRPTAMFKKTEEREQRTLHSSTQLHGWGTREKPEDDVSGSRCRTPQPVRRTCHSVNTVCLFSHRAILQSDAAFVSATATNDCP